MTSDFGESPFFASGRVDSLPSLRWLRDLAPVDLRDLVGIRARTVPSLVGRDDADVLDESARKCAECADVAFAAPWPELDAVLAQIAAQLHLNLRLEAHVGKLLLYETGSFFRPHRDAEHRPGHFLSLVLDLASDCDGGAVRFGAPSAVSDRVLTVLAASSASHVAAQWHSRAHAWAAWFASSWHAVDALTRGYRVVLTLDIVAHAADNAPLYPPMPRHAGVPPFAALVWDNIASFLPLADCARLARTCHALRAIVGGDTARLLARHLRANEPRLVRALQRRKYHSIGAVCRHAYLFDSSSGDPFVAPSLLKGRDRAFAEALRLLGYKITVRRVTLLDEFPSDQDSIVKRCRVGLAVLDARYEGAIFRIVYGDDDADDASRECAAMLAKLLPKVRMRDYHAIGDTQTEFDGELEAGAMVVPFPGVLWFETLASVMSAWNTATGMTCDNLWGNQSMFGLRSFEACAIVAEVLSVDEMEQVALADDIRGRYCQLNELANDDNAAPL